MGTSFDWGLIFNKLVPHTGKSMTHLLSIISIGIDLYFKGRNVSLTKILAYLLILWIV